MKFIVFVFGHTLLPLLGIYREAPWLVKVLLKVRWRIPWPERCPWRVP
jgi:hypothetical protein